MGTFGNRRVFFVSYPFRIFLFFHSCLPYRSIPFTEKHSGISGISGCQRARPFGRSNVRIIPIVASTSATVPTNRGWTPVDPVGPGRPQLNPLPIFFPILFFWSSLLHFYFRLNRLRSWTAGDPLVFQRSRSLFGLHSSAILYTLQRKQLKIRFFSSLGFVKLFCLFCFHAARNIQLRPPSTDGPCDLPGSTHSCSPRSGTRSFLLRHWNRRKALLEDSSPSFFPSSSSPSLAPRCIKFSDPFFR